MSIGWPNKKVQKKLNSCNAHLHHQSIKTPILKSIKYFLYFFISLNSSKNNTKVKKPGEKNVCEFVVASCRLLFGSYILFLFFVVAWSRVMPPRCMMGRKKGRQAIDPLISRYPRSLEFQIISRIIITGKLYYTFYVLLCWCHALVKLVKYIWDNLKYILHDIFLVDNDAAFMITAIFYVFIGR